MLSLSRLREYRRLRRLPRLTIEAENAVAQFPELVERSAHGLPAPLVLSLTSYPKRYPTLIKTLKSLLDQTVVPDHTILWIAKDDVDELPVEVRSLKRLGLEIATCTDIRSYKKLVPALLNFPSCYLVTADDDVYYSPSWLSSLIKPALTHHVIVAGRAHLAPLHDDGSLRSYAKWQFNTPRTRPHNNRTRLFPTGVGGVLYPPGAFDPRVTDKALFTQLCPHADDIWFFWMARLAGTYQIRSTPPYELVPWDSSQEMALFHDNVTEGGNDRQIQAMEQFFGPIP